MQYKAKRKAAECRLIVKVKASRGETFDEKTLLGFERLGLRGFLKPKLVKRNLIEYTGPIGLSVRERLRSPVSKRDFFFMMEQIVMAVRKIHFNKLSVNRLILNVEYCYVNEVTKELQFLYVPTVQEIDSYGVIAFMQTIAHSTVPTEKENDGYILRFMNFLKGQRGFQVDAIENYIATEDRNVVSTVRRQNVGQSGFMTSKQRHYYEHYDGKDAATPAQQSQPVSAPNGGNVAGYAAVNDEEKTGLLEHYEQAAAPQSSQRPNTAWGSYTAPAAPVNEEATGLLEHYEQAAAQQSSQRPNAAWGGYTAPAAPVNEEATGLLEHYEQAAAQQSSQRPSVAWGGYTAPAAPVNEEATGLLEHYEQAAAQQSSQRPNAGWGGYAAPTGAAHTPAQERSSFGEPAMRFYAPQAEQPGRMSRQAPAAQVPFNAPTPFPENRAPSVQEGYDEGGTALLNENYSVRYPSLYRVSTCETVYVNKPVFRIGKERNYVDYFVMNNSAVSRSHADIITRGSRYFVIDLNSKNHTFINNRAIPVQCETELRDGDNLRLANEEFVFHLY